VFSYSYSYSLVLSRKIYPLLRTEGCPPPAGGAVVGLHVVELRSPWPLIAAQIPRDGVGREAEETKVFCYSFYAGVEVESSRMATGYDWFFSPKITNDTYVVSRLPALLDFVKGR
jgi:hypothetical protein